MNVKILSSILDYPHPGLDPAVWGTDGKLLPEQKETILTRLNANLQKANLKHFDKWASYVHIVGSLTTYQYISTSDCDVHILVDIPKFIETENHGKDVAEVELFLDEVRKNFFDDKAFFLKDTKHPVEYYFVTPKSSDDTTRVGVYDVLTDVWVKDPVAVGHDFDIEDSKPKFIEEAAQMAGEIDVSLGDIKRQIMRIEELQETIKAWDSKSKKLFKEKLDAKLEHIEAEIQELIDIKVKMVQTRHTKEFDAQSEDEIKFKYLQKFGYFYIITQLKELLEVTEDTVAVTEEKVPEIKEIINTPENKIAALDEMHNKLMIDFDNTVAENGPDHKIGEPMPGVKAAFDKLKEEGWQIVIYSGRANSPEGIDQIKEFMNKHELPFDEIFVGKPLAEYYIDDRNIVFTNWKDVVRTVDKNPKKTAQHNVEYDFSSTHFMLPKDIAQKIVEWSVKNIPNDDLYDDETKRYARELESHITILFGLLTNDSKEVEELLKDEEPVRVKFKKTKVFENDMDAVFIEVESEGVDRLHKKLKELKNEDQQPNYSPHCTVAYVKSGLGKKYTGEDILEGLEVELDTIKFSPKEGDPIFITLGGKQKKEAGENIPINNWGVIMKNPTADDAEELFNHSVDKELRWGARGNRDLYIWDASLFTHHAAATYLGFSFGYQNFDTGVLGSVETARDWANRFEKDRYESQEESKRFEQEQNKRVAGLDVVAYLIEKKATLHWVSPEGQVSEEVTQDKSRFEQFLNQGWVAMDTSSSPVRVVVDELEFTPDYLDSFLNKKVPYGEDVIITDKHGNNVDITFPLKNIKRRIQRELYKPEDTTAAFMPSIVQAPDNPWQQDSDVELPLDPDTVSAEETYYTGNIVDKPQPKSIWDKLLDMFKGDAPEENDAKKASLKKKASDARGWIDPNGQFFPLGDYDYEEGSGTTHADWIGDDFDWLSEKYHLNKQELEMSGDPVSYLVDHGWVRVTDDYHRLGVQLASITAIPTFVYDHLLANAPGNESVTIEDQIGQHVTVEDWAGGLQKAVNRELRTKRLSQPTASLRKQADVMADILHVVQSTGGATWNFSKGNLAGTANFAVSIYPEHTVIVNHTLTIDDLNAYVDSQHDLLSQSENSLGIWKNGDQYYLDVTLTIPDKAKAIELGKQHNQISIFDLQTFQEIPTGGTGEVQSKQAKSVEDVGGIKVLINPMPDQVRVMWQKSIDNQLRALVDPATGNIYVWDAFECEHDRMIRYFDLNIDWEGDDGTSIRHVANEDDIGYLFEAQEEIRAKKRTASLGLSKHAFSIAMWVDPNGKTYRIETSHEVWIEKNLNLLIQKYNYTEFDVEGPIPEKAFVNQLLELGWVRVAAWEQGSGYLQIADLTNPPQALQHFLDENYDWESAKTIIIDDISDRYAEVDVTGDVANDIKNALRLSHRASLEKTAFSAHAVWIDPKGVVYEVRGENKGRNTTHAVWVDENRDMLRKKYKIKVPHFNDSEPTFEVNSILIAKGWTRIGDYHGANIGIRTLDIHHIPSAVEDVLASFATEGTQIHIEDIDQNEYANVVYPFKSLQREVNRSLNENEQRRQKRIEQDRQDMERINQDERRKEQERLRQEEKDWKLKKVIDEMDEMEKNKDVPIPNQNPNRRPEQLELPLAGKVKEAFESPATTWDGTEPFSPLPTTFTTDTNDDNLNSRYPWKFMKKPTGPNYSNEGEVDDMLIEDENPTAKRTAALTREAMGKTGYWISPEGEVFNIRPKTHRGWIQENMEMLKEKYHLPKSMQNEERLFDILINDYNWVRVGDSMIDSTHINVQLRDLRSVPSSVDNLLAEIWQPGMILDVEDGGTFSKAGHIVQINDPFPTLQKAVNKALVAVAELSLPLSKHAYNEGLKDGFWISPDGQRYSVAEHLKLLKEKPEMFGLKPSQVNTVYSQGYAPILQRGWTRVRGYSNDLYINAGTLDMAKNAEDAIYEMMKGYKTITVSFANGQSVSTSVRDFKANGWDAFSRNMELSSAAKPKPASPAQVDGHISPDGQFYTNEGLTHNQWSHKYFKRDSSDLLKQGWVRIAGGSGVGFAAEYTKPPTDSQWQMVEGMLFGSPDTNVVLDYWSPSGDLSIFKPVYVKDLDAAGVSLKEYATTLKPWKTIGGSLKRRAYSDKAVKDEAYGLWQQALEAWDAKVNPIEQFIMQNGGIASYRPSGDNRQVDEREEYRGIPVRLRGTVPYDEMIDRLKSEHLIDPDASYGDLYELVSHLPERGQRPQVRDFIDEAKHNLEHDEVSDADLPTLGAKTAGNLSNTYTDDQMETIYDEQHQDEMKQDDGGGYTPRDFGDSSTDFPKPEDMERKQKIQLDLLEPTQTPPIASYEVTWYMGTPADDNGSM